MGFSLCHVILHREEILNQTIPEPSDRVLSVPQLWLKQTSVLIYEVSFLNVLKHIQILQKYPISQGDCGAENLG